MLVELKHRITGAVLFSCELPEEVAALSRCRQIGYAVKEAKKRGAYLSDADLSGAYLRGAYLRGAYLGGADLRGAYLSDADLSGADLRGAYLSDADLRDADLRGAYLSDADLRDADLSDADLSGAYLSDADLSGADLGGADLRGAYLSDAYLRDADLRGAYLSDADLRDADLSGADLSGADLSDADLRGAKNLPAGIKATDPPEPYERNPPPERYAARAQRFRERNPDVPVIENLDAQILGIIESGAGKLEMSQWHTCETTHCMAGWAIHLAGKRGYELQSQFGPAGAARRLFIASTGRAPHFFASNERALEDLRERVAETAA